VLFFEDTKVFARSKLGGKVFSEDLPLPVWWEIILICFVGLMDPENI